MTKKIIIIAFVIALWMGYSARGNSELPLFHKPEIHLVKPDVTSVISASILSIRAQNQLLVMTTGLSAVATSETSMMGMTGRRTDIQSADAQYLVDLSQLSQKDIVVTADKLIVKLPASSLLIKPLPAYARESYDNNSWLFTMDSDIVKTLQRANLKKIQTSFHDQSVGMRNQALMNARIALTTLFEAPLRATGFQQKVEVEFV